MKKILFLLICAATLITTSQAQVRYGLKAGANFATLTNADGAKMKVAFNAGAFAHVPLSSMFSFHPELVYSAQGDKFDGGSDNLSYINVPVLVQYNNPSGFFVETGPQIGLLMSAKTKVDGGGTDDIKSQLKSTDFAWAIGAGYVSSANIGFGVRYNAGLSNIVDVSGAPTVHNSVFQISVSYWFGSADTKKGK